MYTYLGDGLLSLCYSTEEIAGVIVFYGCGAISGVLLGGRMTDRLGAQLTSTIGLAGLCLCFLLVHLALDAGVLVSCAFGLLSAVAQLFFLGSAYQPCERVPRRPRDHSGLEQQRPLSGDLAWFLDRRAGYLAWRPRHEPDDLGGDRDCRVDHKLGRSSPTPPRHPTQTVTGYHATGSIASTIWGATGKVTVTVVPAPSSLSKSRVPP
jgi:hypothetical protein